ncbi:MAG TPA: RHS repeat-associated core domain-containing protein [Bacteroidales bacterium]|jgi:RHS repeat-associated protein|nr:RHS repeat-associated core domain-containing protein [Bacteroidales bacterium]HPU46945.1 RHS repeat-associated core domain-containing protein [Bacteroidales bacterium]HXK90925.1 RHS repeat-associated core domain-containing protein [Bacteroidales bacterium]
MYPTKELDNETSQTYFGARYYDSELSGWLSVDPMSDEKRWISPNAYCQWNTLIRIDSTGLFDIETGTIEKVDNLTKITKQINEKFGVKLTISDIVKANNIENVNKIQVRNKSALPGQNVELNFDLKSLKVTDATYGIYMPGLSWEATTRTWLTPMKGTNTFGRGNFSIHGGTTLGSAGCIDLTGKNYSLHNWLKSYGKPIKLNVKY